METIDAQTLFENVNALATGHCAFPADREFYTYRAGLDLALRRAWRSEAFPELMVSEARTPDNDNQLAYVPGILDTFSRVGTVFGVFANDPLTSYDRAAVNFHLIDGAVQLLDTATTVWLWFRKPCPSLLGNLFVTTETYAVGEQVYFEPAGSRGNFYNCITATSAGQSPTTHAAKWDLVEIPEMFRGYLEWQTYANTLPFNIDGQRNETRALALATADTYLNDLMDELLRQQAQAPSMPIRTY